MKSASVLFLCPKTERKVYVKIKYNTPFTMIENKVIRSSLLTIYQKLIYIALCSYANDSNICFPSYKTIAAAVGCSRRKVIDSIKELVDLKLIVKHKSQNTAAMDLYIKSENRRMNIGNFYAGQSPTTH